MENSSAALKLSGGDNWVAWKFQTRVVLKSRGYYDIVIGKSVRPSTTGDDQKKWDASDSKAQEFIVTRIEQGPMTHILSCETSKDMWTKLKSVYDKESEVSIHLMQQKFFLLEFSSGKNVASFISQLEEIKNKLKQAGEELSDKMIMTKILMALPEEYKHFRSAWESVPSDKQTLDELTSRLLIEEERSKSAQGSTALAMKSDTSREFKGQKKTRLKCHFCGRGGHIAKNCFFKKKERDNNSQKDIKVCSQCKRRGHNLQECWFNKNKNEKQQTSREENKIDSNAFMVYTGSKKNKNEWCLDTGASEHMCWNQDLFEELIEISYKKQVKVGNGEKLPVKGIGKITLWAFNGKKFIKSTLSDVLFVPDLQFNLFSAGCALDKGYKMFSNNEKCEFYNDKGEIRALATRDNKLYKMLFSQEQNTETFANILISERTPNENLSDGQVQENSCLVDVFLSECNSAKTTESLRVWHCRLAHQNTTYVRNFLRQNNIDFIDEKFVCEQCLTGKQHRIPFKLSESRASEPLQLVHTDVCGPMEEESLGGNRYFLLLKDDYTNYRYAYFMKNKSEVKKHLKNFISLAERETGCKMKNLRSDNGLEFMNQEIKEMLDYQGIKHQRSVVYTPQQNGRAERENRTLVESARTMIQGQKLNKNLWAEAIHTAVYVLNRTGPSSIKNVTPYELWYKKKVNNISTLKSFGSRVSVHVPKEKRLKWDAKNMFGFFIGYSEDVKGYKIFVPDKNKVEIHRDVIFLPEKTIEIKNGETDMNKNIQMICEEIKSEEDDSEAEEPQNNREESSESDLETDSSVEDVNEIEQEHGYDLRRHIKRPSRYDDYVLDDDEMSLLTFSDDEEPQTYDDAVASSECKNWKKAMQSEINALLENETWEFVQSSDGQKVIECKWVFKKKKNENGKVVKYKARLVARGFQQIGMFFNDIYSPVAKLPSIRIFLAMCNTFDMKIHQVDVCSAFLNGDIKENVFISLPKGFKEKEGTICKLRKSLYGLKSSPKNWNDKFHNLMQNLSFSRSEYEYCLYIKVNEKGRIYILLYVDDLLLAGTNDQEVEKIKYILNKNFKMNDLGQIKHFLGMCITQNLSEGKIKINQTVYLKNVLKKFDMSSCKPSTTPMDNNFHHDFLKRKKSESIEIEKKCRVAIGCLMYAMLCSRPDLCIAIGILSRYQTCASNDLWVAIKRVLRYIQSTVTMSLIYYKHKYKQENLIVGYSDSDWAGDRTDRKSTSGYVFKVFNCTVSWASRKQSTVSLSSTEAEYVALSVCVSEACWLRYLMYDLKIKPDYVAVLIHADNQSAIRVSRNPEFHKRLKHVDIRFHFVRDKIKENIVVLKYLNTSDQQADICTKPLGLTLFKKFRELLGLE